jgi:protoporphyrinogen oxidase
MSAGKQVVVLGGGIAGIAAAHHLAVDHGCSVRLLEGAGRLGGLLRSVEHDGLHFDIGSFLFPHDHELLRAFPRAAARFVRVRPAQMVYTPGGGTDRYPVSLGGYVRNRGALELARSLADLLYSRLAYRDRATVPRYARYYMGGRIYRNSGLKHYVERLYGIADDQVALQLAERTIARIRDYTLTGLLRGRLTAALARARGRPAPHVVARPDGGFDPVFASMGDALRERGVRVELGARVQSVAREGDGFVVTAEGHELGCDAVVSTIPLPVMLRLAGMEPEMRFDALPLLSLFYRGRVRPGAPLLYNFSETGQWKRITVFSGYYGRRGGDDWLTVEVSARDTSPAAMERARDEFERHAAALEMFAGTPELLGQQLTRNAYPVFRLGDPERVARERRRLEEVGVRLLGRQGSFEYLSSNAAMQRARRVAAGVA